MQLPNRKNVCNVTHELQAPDLLTLGYEEDEAKGCLMQTFNYTFVIGIVIV
jgi:hypothetical protein